MKKIFKLVLIILILISISLLYLFFQRSDDEDNPEGSPAKIVENPNNLSFQYDGQKLTARWFIVDNAENIVLYPNFSEKLTSQQAFLQKNCTYLVNGSFYTKDDRPIALFITEGKTLRQANSNSLANGFFTISYDNQTSISDSAITDNVRAGIQSGPLLVSKKSYQEINSSSSDNSRRVVVGVTHENKIIFFVVYQNSSAFLGPKLSALPDILKLVSEKTGISFQDALNLDGGSASAFYMEGETLSEMSLLGSYFCIKVDF